MPICCRYTDDNGRCKTCGTQTNKSLKFGDKDYFKSGEELAESGFESVGNDLEQLEMFT